MNPKPQTLTTKALMLGSWGMFDLEEWKDERFAAQAPDLGPASASLFSCSVRV